jgi:ATP-binding cassette subfamily F protein 3
MRAKDVLLEAIAAFSGTVVFVSHDRYFIDRLATRVIEVENGAVTSYEGNYEDYLRRKGLAAGSALVDTDGKTKTPEPAQQTGAPSIRRTLANGWESKSLESAAAQSDSTLQIDSAKDRPRRLNPIKQKQMEERCTFLEEEVPRIESALAHTEEQLGIYISAAESQRLTTLAEDLRTQLASLTAEWEELMMQLEEQSTIG